MDYAKQHYSEPMYQLSEWSASQRRWNPWSAEFQLRHDNLNLSEGSRTATGISEVGLPESQAGNIEIDMLPNTINIR